MPKDPGSSFFYPTDTIQPLAGPLLDYASNLLMDPSVGIGGNSSLLSASLQDLMPIAKVDLNPDPPPNIGKRILVTATDWPKTSYYSEDPAFPASLLTGAQFSQDFSAYLVLWATAIAQQPGGFGTPPPVAANPDGTLECADRTYAVLVKQPWSIRATFQPIDGTGHTNPTSVSGVTLGWFTYYDFGAPADSKGVILTPPIGGPATKDNVQK